MISTFCDNDFYSTKKLSVKWYNFIFGNIWRIKYFKQFGLLDLPYWMVLGINPYSCPQIAKTSWTYRPG